ncbi:MAG: hypothetical protein ACOY3D_00530, partial [Candidatus Omnitrophota bacterium]
ITGKTSSPAKTQGTSYCSSGATAIIKASQSVAAFGVDATVAGSSPATTNSSSATKVFKPLFILTAITLFLFASAKAQQGELVQFPSSRNIYTGQISYTPVYVVSKDTTSTEAGPIITLYTNQEFVGASGFNAILPKDRRVVVALGNIESEAREIEVAISQNKIPSRLIEGAQEYQDSTAYLARLKLIYLDFVRRDFAGKSAEQIRQALKEQVKYHELTHKAAALKGYRDTENLADFRSITKVAAPFYNLAQLFIESGRFDLLTLIIFGEEIGSPFRFTDENGLNKWIAASIIPLNRAKLVNAARQTYAHVANRGDVFVKAVIENHLQSVERSAKIANYFHTVQYWQEVFSAEGAEEKTTRGIDLVTPGVEELIERYNSGLSINASIFTATIRKNLLRVNGGSSPASSPVILNAFPVKALVEQAISHFAKTLEFYTESLVYPGLVLISLGLASRLAAKRWSTQLTQLSASLIYLRARLKIKWRSMSRKPADDLGNIMSQLAEYQHITGKTSSPAKTQGTSYCSSGATAIIKASQSVAAFGVDATVAGQAAQASLHTTYLSLPTDNASSPLTRILKRIAIGLTAASLLFFAYNVLKIFVIAPNYLVWLRWVGVLSAAGAGVLSLVALKKAIVWQSFARVKSAKASVMAPLTMIIVLATAFNIIAIKQGMKTPHILREQVTQTLASIDKTSEFISTDSSLTQSNEGILAKPTSEIRHRTYTMHHTVAGIFRTDETAHVILVPMGDRYQLGVVASGKVPFAEGTMERMISRDPEVIIAMNGGYSDWDDAGWSVWPSGLIVLNGNEVSGYSAKVKTEYVLVITAEGRIIIARVEDYLNGRPPFDKGLSGLTAIHAGFPLMLNGQAAPFADREAEIEQNRSWGIIFQWLDR